MRRRIFIAFAALVVGVLGALVATVLVATRTEWGLRKVVAFTEGLVNRNIKGHLHLGKLGGTLFTGLTLDTLELRDRNDSLFIAVGRLELSYDPRDLMDRRILMSRVRIGSLRANLFEDSVGQFNFRRIFESDEPASPPPVEPPTTRRGWGQFVKLEDVIVDSVNVTLSTRWNPSDLLTGVARDSVIRYNLQRNDKEIWRGPGVYYETRRWTNGHLELDSARIDDRQPGGRYFALRNSSIDESDPPFRFRNLSGDIRLQGDTVWPDVTHFELPGSRGTIEGRVWGWSSGPARFDLTVRSDSVSLADIAWVYPTLPSTGSGSMQLQIRSQTDPRIIDYVLSNMDVRSTQSRLRGAMTFGVGAPLLIVKDVDLAAQPLDFTLIEQLSGEPLPYPWRGQITGTLLASGGPLDDWMVDQADLVFRDANVPGAVTVGKAAGRLNIAEPSDVVFDGLQVNLDQLDLRTLQYLIPTFPRLNGHIAGRAVLDSIWTDVRFREADITHTDGSGPETRMAGAGRVTFADTYTAYDLALTAEPISFTTFSRAYTESHIPLKGEYTGPMRLFGTAQDLAVTTQLQGPAGSIAYDGRVDGDSLGGYGLDGTFSYAGLDLRTLLDTAVTPNTDLWGRTTLDVTFDSLLTLKGAATVAFDRNSRIDSVVVYGGSRSRMRFDDGLLQVLPGDTLRYDGGQVVAHGGLGLGGGHRDSLHLDVRLDSLGGIRPYLDVSPTDTLDGVLTGSLTLAGSIDTLGIRGWVRGDSLRMPGLWGRMVTVRPDLTDVFGAVGGRVEVTSSDLSLGGVRFASVDGDVDLERGVAGNYGLFAAAANGPSILSNGALQFAGDTTTIQVRELALTLTGNRYRLEQPGRVRVSPGRVTIDSLTLAGQDQTRISFVADAPDRANITADLGVSQLSLADLSELLQSEIRLHGRLSGSVSVSGTRDDPRMSGRASLSNLSAGDVRVASVAMEGQYADRRFEGRGLVTQADTTVLTVTADIPYDLALRARDRRQVDDTMRVSVRSPDVDLSILGTFTPDVRAASGTFTANMDLVGPPGATELNGAMTVTRGRATLPGLGITLRDMHARLLASNDTLRIDTLSVVSGPESDDLFTLRGWIAHPLNGDSASFDLAGRATEFHAIGLEKQLADLTLDANVSWTGTSAASHAEGTITVQRGSIALPESSDKDLFAIDNWQELGIDSVAVREAGLLPSQASIFLRGLEAKDVRIAMGPDVWLRSEDAAIKLSGAVNLDVCRAATGGCSPDRFGETNTRGLSENQLVLTGDLQTERGTYRLNVSPFQRTFLVESGRLRFPGTPGFNPDLDIRAVYTSRQVGTNYGGRNDVRVGARITGTLDRPVLSLYSADSLSFLSEPDLWSYVLFNRPSFAVGRGTAERDIAVSLLLGTASSFASSYASRFAGGLVDYVQLQTSSEVALFGGPGDQGFLNQAFEGAQLGIGRQLGDRFFFSLTSGLCPFFNTADPNRWKSLGESLGAKLEYRFGPRSPAGLSFAYEPSFNKLLCNNAGDVGFVGERKQIGFDLFRVWRR